MSNENDLLMAQSKERRLRIVVWLIPIIWGILSFIIFSIASIAINIAAYSSCGYNFASGTSIWQPFLNLYLWYSADTIPGFFLLTLFFMLPGFLAAIRPVKVILQGKEKSFVFRSCFEGIVVWLIIILIYSCCFFAAPRC